MFVWWFVCVCEGVVVGGIGCGLVSVCICVLFVDDYVLLCVGFCMIFEM